MDDFLLEKLDQKPCVVTLDFSSQLSCLCTPLEAGFVTRTASLCKQTCGKLKAWNTRMGIPGSPARTQIIATLEIVQDLPLDSRTLQYHASRYYACMREQHSLVEHACTWPV